MFHWFEAIGMTTPISIVRTWVDGLGNYMPTWVVYSLPFALWVSSYLLFVKGIWWNSTSRFRHVWFWCIPVIAIATELAQDNISTIPGHFDPVDLIALIIGTVLGFGAVDFNQLKTGETK